MWNKELYFTPMKHVNTHNSSVSMLRHWPPPWKPPSKATLTTSILSHKIRGGNSLPYTMYHSKPPRPGATPLRVENSCLSSVQEWLYLNWNQEPITPCYPSPSLTCIFQNRATSQSLPAPPCTYHWTRSWHNPTTSLTQSHQVTHMANHAPPPLAPP